MTGSLFSGYFGLAIVNIEVKEHNTFKPETDYIGLDVIVSYEKGPIYAEIEVDTPGDMDENGISVIPEFDYSLKAFTFYVNCAIDNIGSDADTALSPALGIKYSF